MEKVLSKKATFVRKENKLENKTKNFVHKIRLAHKCFEQAGIKNERTKIYIKKSRII